MMFLHLLLHIALHHVLLFSSANVVCDLLLLFFIPLLFQLYASTRGALHWLYKVQHLLQQVGVVNVTIAFLVVVLCLEVRVVFCSFGQYIQIPSPWNYIFVTVAAVGGAAGLGAYPVGLIGDAVALFYYFFYDGGFIFGICRDRLALDGVSLCSCWEVPGCCRQWLMMLDKLSPVGVKAVIEDEA